MFIHIDMDYFYAQAEEKRRPMTGGKIIIVCMYSGRTADSGVVSSVNYKGRALGIHAGMPIIQAKKRAPAPESIFLPADREYYGDVSQQIDAVIRSKLDKVVQASVDEWNGEDQGAAGKAQVVKDAILKASGLACSVGVAPSLLGAKMAASKCKPDGILILAAPEEKKMIDESAVEKVPGIGPKTAEALSQIGIKRVKDIAKADPTILSEIFGRKTGSWLIDIGNGRYSAILGEEKEQEEVSRIGTLKEMTRDPYFILAKADELEKEAKEWLLAMKKSYQTMGLIFITDDMKTHTKSISFKKPRGWSEDNRKEKESLLREFLESNPRQVRRIGIRFGNFMDLGKQTTLF